MTKIGKKGFMMAEVVVVSVIVAVTLVTLYTSISRVTTAFNLRNRYHDLDCLNLSIAVNDTLISSDKINELLRNNVISQKVNTDASEIINLYSNVNSVNVYYIKNNNGLNMNNIGTVKPTTSEYFDYLKKTFDTGNNYYIVSEICKTTDDCYYYGLGVK